VPAEEWRIDAALHLGGGSELVPGLQIVQACRLARCSYLAVYAVKTYSKELS
jgi:hypothetical protein